MLWNRTPGHPQPQPLPVGFSGPDVTQVTNLQVTATMPPRNWPVRAMRVGASAPGHPRHEECQDGAVTPRAPTPARGVAPVAVPSGAYVALAATDTYLAGHRSSLVRSLRLLTKPLMMPALMLAFARATQ